VYNESQIKATDRTLKDLKCNNKLISGITFVFAGDFRQTLPVIHKDTRADVMPLYGTMSKNFICEQT
jgi:hypothetical protein